MASYIENLGFGYFVIAFFLLKLTDSIICYAYIFFNKTAAQLLNHFTNNPAFVESGFNRKIKLFFIENIRVFCLTVNI